VGLSVADGDALRGVTESELLDWDHAFHHLCDHALLHLRGRMRSHELSPIDTLPGIWQVRSTDGLAASRLLCLSDVLRPWPLEGAVVCCPGPDQLLIVPLEGLVCLPALQALLRRVARARFEEGTLSDQLFWCDEAGRWHHLPVFHGPDGVDMDPPRALLSALERAAAIDLVGMAAEA